MPKFCCARFAADYGNQQIYQDENGTWYSHLDPRPMNFCGWCARPLPGGEERAKKFGYDPSKPRRKFRPIELT